MNDHLNNIQKVCTNLESSTELVLGQIYGMRQWRIHEPDSIGNGPQFRGHNYGDWDVTEVNSAKCILATRRVSKSLSVSARRDLSKQLITEYIVRYAEEMFREHSDTYGIEIYITGGVSPLFVRFPLDLHSFRIPWSIRATPEGFIVGGTYIGNMLHIDLEGSIPVYPHEITDPDCTCGFYAYTDKDSLYKNSSTSKTTYFGIVKAWGKVTQGTKGFRAEKAQILGLTGPMEYHEYYEMPPMFDTLYVSEDEFPQTAFYPQIRREWIPLHELEAPYERQLIPTDFPRYSSLDEMLDIYQELTENHGGRQ